MTPKRHPLFTLHWIYADTRIQQNADKLESDRDFMEAFQNAAVDRGDRAYHQPTGIFTWQNSGWRLRDMVAFIVDIDGDTDPAKAVEWLVKRGYKDVEKQMGFVYDLVFSHELSLTLGSTMGMSKLTHVQFGDDHWAIAEKWAINLSQLVSHQIVYGDLNVIADSWAGS